MTESEEKTMNDFIRIAKAKIRKYYPFKSQRSAVAAKMYSNWIQRKKELKKLKQRRENGHDGYHFIYWE